MSSDNGTQFDASVVHQVGFFLDFKRTLTPVYHSEYNSLERSNRDLKYLLEKQISCRSFPNELIL